MINIRGVDKGVHRIVESIWWICHAVIFNLISVERTSIYTFF